MGKFFNEHSARCTRCGTYLKSLGLARNENHLYPIGTLYGCRCRASKVWTNSIRNEAALLAHYETGSRYYQGFCNDLFDGEGREIVLWRSVDFPGEQQRGQVYGTYESYNRFEEGQGPDSTLVVWSDRFSPEIEGTQELRAEYAKYAEEIKRLVSVRSNPEERALHHNPLTVWRIENDAGEGPYESHLRELKQHQQPGESVREAWDRYAKQVKFRKRKRNPTTDPRSRP